MSVPGLKVVLVGELVMVLLAIGATWKVQDWRYGKQLAEQADLHQNDLTAINNAASAQMSTNQENRLALEQRLSANDQAHYKEMSDAQTKQARLRDRLATADLRLSVLLAEDSAGSWSVPTTAGAVGMVHGGARARLEPAHAQRTIGITNAGDQGLIALAACQAYVKAVTATK